MENKNGGKKIVLKAENIYFSYDEQENNGDEKKIVKNVLEDVSAEFEEGSFTAIIGHNGSGKSTLAKLFNMILTPKSGRITAAGIDTSDPENIMKVRQKVGMVFQNPDNQIVSTVVEEDVAFGPENLGLPPDEIRRRVDSALKTVEMENFRLHSPGMLSGGQKQRIAIAGVIAMMPEIIIFDESTAMLDPHGRDEVLAAVKRLNREYNMTVILITHYMNEAVMADKVLVLNKGRKFLEGSPGQVFTQTEKLQSAGLETPQVTELMRLLDEEKKVNSALKRYSFPKGILHTKDAADIIQTLYLMNNN